MGDTYLTDHDGPGALARGLAPVVATAFPLINLPTFILASLS